MSSIEARLKAMGVTLPAPPTPVGSYAPAVIAGELLFVSGQLPLGPDGAIAPAHKGKLGQDIFNEAGQEAARLCAINVLAQARLALDGDLARIRQCVRLGGFVNAGPKFHAIAAVVNGASDFIAAALGPEKGRHARAAVGVAELPLDAAIEIDAIFVIKPR
jgi:enamine deaminase RidA (YjgF/YER057c/UK114 family)